MRKNQMHCRRLILRKINGTLGKKIANILIHDIAPIMKIGTVDIQELLN